MQPMQPAAPINADPPDVEENAETPLMSQKRMDGSTTIQYASEDNPDVLLPCSLLVIGCCFIPFLLPCFACLNVRRYKTHKQTRELSRDEKTIYDLSYITIVISIIFLGALAILVGIAWIYRDDIVFIKTIKTN